MNAEELQAEAKKIVRADRANFQPLRLEADIIALMTRAVREEREACAKACDGQTLKEHDNSTMSIGINAGIQRVKDAEINS